MFSWQLYENQENIQIVPEGEEYLHEFDFECLCRPRMSKRIWDEKPICTHNAHDGRQMFENAELTSLIYYPLSRYTKDC